MSKYIDGLFSEVAYRYRWPTGTRPVKERDTVCCPTPAASGVAGSHGEVRLFELGEGSKYRAGFGAKFGDLPGKDVFVVYGGVEAEGKLCTTPSEAREYFLDSLDRRLERIDLRRR